VGNHQLRNGRVMPFASPDGAAHPDSFWCLDRISVEIGDAALRLKFIGYHSVDAYDEDRHPVTGAVKEYLVTGAEFMAAITLATAGAGIPISAEITRLAWAVALDVTDTADPENEEEMISFFASAEAPPA